MNNHLLDLPLEILHYICLFLNTSDKYLLSKTNKELYFIIWKSHPCSHFPNMVLDIRDFYDKMFCFFYLHYYCSLLLNENKWIGFPFVFELSTENIISLAFSSSENKFRINLMKCNGNYFHEKDLLNLFPLKKIGFVCNDENNKAINRKFYQIKMFPLNDMIMKIEMIHYYVMQIMSYFKMSYYEAGMETFIDWNSSIEENLVQIQSGNEDFFVQRMNSVKEEYYTFDDWHIPSQMKSSQVFEMKVYKIMYKNLFCELHNKLKHYDESTLIRLSKKLSTLL